MNGNELRRILSDEIYKIRNGKSKPDRVNAITNAASKIIASVRIELDYCKQFGGVPSIPFMGTKLEVKPTRKAVAKK